MMRTHAKICGLDKKALLVSSISHRTPACCCCCDLLAPPHKKKEPPGKLSSRSRKKSKLPGFAFRLRSSTKRMFCKQYLHGGCEGCV